MRGNDFTSSFSRAGTGTDPLWGFRAPQANAGAERPERQAELTRFASAARPPAGAGPEGGRGERRGQGWRGVAWWGSHQGLAVAAGNGAQGVALVEVVHEAHAAAQHRAGAQEVGHHFLPADAAIPAGGRGGRGSASGRGPPPGPATHQPNPSHWELPYQGKDPHPTPGFRFPGAGNRGLDLGARQKRQPLLLVWSWASHFPWVSFPEK